MKVSRLAVILLLASCRTTSETQSTLLQQSELGERWSFQDCKVRSLEGDEPTERLSQFSVFVNANANGALFFTDEFSEQYELKSKVKDTPIVVGKAHLVNAVDLDTKPIVIKYQAPEQIIHTRTQAPTKYVDEGTQQAFELSRYSRSGDAVTIQLLHPHNKQSPKYLVTRICGSGFGFQLGQQGAADVEMVKEASL